MRFPPRLAIRRKRWLRPSTLRSNRLKDSLRCGIDQNRVALTGSDDIDSLSYQLAQRRFSPDERIAPIAIHQHVACAATKTGACTLGGSLVRGSHVAGSAMGVRDHAGECRAFLRPGSGWSQSPPFFGNAFRAMTCEGDRGSAEDCRECQRRK